MSSKKSEFLFKDIWGWWGNRLQAKLFVVPVLLVLLGLCMTYAFEALYYQHRQEERSQDVVQEVLKSSRQDLEALMTKYGELAKLIDMASTGQLTTPEFEAKSQPFIKPSAEDGLLQFGYFSIKEGKAVQMLWFGDGAERLAQSEPPLSLSHAAFQQTFRLLMQQKNWVVSSPIQVKGGTTQGYRRLAVFPVTKSGEIVAAGFYWVSDRRVTRLDDEGVIKLSDINQVVVANDYLLSSKEFSWTGSPRLNTQNADVDYEFMIDRGFMRFVFFLGFILSALFGIGAWLYIRRFFTVAAVAADVHSQDGTFDIHRMVLDAAIAIDRHGQVHSANTLALKLLGYRETEMVGRGLIELLNPLGNALLQGGHEPISLQTALLENEPFEAQDAEVTVKSGLVLPVSIKTFNLSDSPEGDLKVFTFRDLTSIKQSQYDTWKKANFDALTGLPNRNLFFDRLTLDLKKTLRSHLILALMFLDLDKFKEINDTHGHQVGDAVLIEVAKRLSECVRESDTVARLGGDEFTILLTQQSDHEHIERVAQKILQRLKDPMRVGNLTFSLTASIGVALAPQDSHDVKELVHYADEAMYLAKKNVRNNAHFFTEPMKNQMQMRQTVMADLQSAISKNELYLLYQPILNLQNDTLEKFECLVRWLHPQNGEIMPKNFIRASEDTGLIVAMGNWVFKQAVMQLATWAKQGIGNKQVSINISPLQFKLFPNCATHWLELLAEHGVVGQNIVIEITENLLLENSADIDRNMHQLREAGMEFALDDFGVGYSSLAYLKKFDIQYLKIDQSFICGMETSKNDLAIVESIISMAQKMGIRVIAEGVENDRQLKLLRNIHCDYAQGYLIGLPNQPPLMI